MTEQALPPAAPAEQQLTVTNHGGEPFAQRLQVGFVMHREGFGNARLGQQFAALFEQGEDRFTAGNRTRITLRLAIGLRVAHGACSGLVALVRCGCGTRRPLGGPLRGTRVRGITG